MNKNNLVTKDFLKKEFEDFRKKIRDEDLVTLRKEIRQDVIELIDSSLIPLFDKIFGQIEEIKDIVNTRKKTRQTRR